MKYCAACKVTNGLNGKIVSPVYTIWFDLVECSSLLFASSKHYYDSWVGFLSNFSLQDLKRITENLTKRFYDPHSQVFNIFLDVLPEFISAYKRELNDWLYTLLTRLLIRLGTPDLLDSVYKKLRNCLAMVNSSFDVHAQFTVLIRFINDNSSAPSIKAKEILLRYLQQIIQQMEPVDISNNPDIRIALSKIINWSGEPKSIEMRKVIASSSMKRWSNI